MREVVAELVEEMPLVVVVDQAVGVIKHPDPVVDMEGRLSIRHLPAGDITLRKDLRGPAFGKSMVGDLERFSLVVSQIVNGLVTCSFDVPKSKRKVDREFLFTFNLNRDPL